MSDYKPDRYKKFIDLLHFFNGKHRAVDVFRDFVVMFAISIKNRIDYKQEDEDIYLSIVKKYTRDEMNIIIKLVTELFSICSNLDETRDVLGEIYSQIGGLSKGLSQVFTPNHIAKMMANMILDLKDNKLKENEYITVLDPTCGSGVLLVGAVNTLESKKINYEDKVLFIGQDLDFICVCMTYIQMCMNCMAGYVIQGNSLTNETFKIFYTPQYYYGKWNNKVEEKCA